MAGKPKAPELTIALELDTNFSRIAMDLAHRYGETPQRTVERALLISDYLGDLVDLASTVYLMSGRPPAEPEATP
jgi:hypothetical protein